MIPENDIILSSKKLNDKIDFWSYVRMQVRQLTKCSSQAMGRVKERPQGAVVTLQPVIEL
jgi:hypothetical protein